MAFALATALGLTAGGAQAAGWGVGGFGGVSIPVVQEDAANGVVFGGHVKLSLGMLGIEPNFTYFKNGDYERDEAPGETFPSSKITSIGVNVLLGGGAPTGLRFFPFVGAKYYNFKQDVPDFSDSQLGFNGGLGLEIGAGAIGIEARGSLEVLPLDPAGSRKWVHVRGGLNYYFGVR
jgi:hypothetical protein